MKKALLVVMIFSLVFAFGGITLAQEQEMEKISSPEQIKEFKVMKKEGGSLFGVRLEKLKNNLEKKTSTTEAKLEKIAHPRELNLFEKIKQIGSALWGFRKAVDKKIIIVKPVAVQCVKDAIDKKDTALKAAITTHSQSILTTLDARTACQKLALDKLTGKEQLESNKVCLETFKKSTKDNNDTLKKSKDATWKVYNTDLKACSALQKAENATSTAVSANTEVAGDIMIGDGESNQDNQ